MQDSRVFFEIQSLDRDRWVTAELRETEITAMNVARSLLANPQISGVRVVKNQRRLSGAVDETVTFIEKRTPKAAPITIVPIIEAHACTDIHNFFGTPSRMTMGRLFRKYLDAAFLTPTELLHNFRALQKLQSHGMLFAAGVDRVAFLQASANGQNPKERREELHHTADRILRRAHKVADSPNLPKLDGYAFDRVLDELAGNVRPGREWYYAMVALCNALVVKRSWLGKFEMLAKIVGSDPRGDVLTLVDGIVADLMGVPSAFQDLMGFQRNLAQMLCSLADLYEGRFLGEKGDAAEQLAIFAPLIAQDRMPQTRMVLMDRLVRQLTGTQPLDRHDPSREEAAFRTVSARLRGPNGVLGGDPVAAALERRALALYGANGIPSVEAEAVSATVEHNKHEAFVAELAANGAGTADFPPGALIYREGDSGHHAYMVLSGSVQLSTKFKGARIMLAQLGEGAIFGELALFSRTPHTASAVTLEGCRLLLIDRTEMAKRVGALDAFCRQWVGYLIERVTDLSGRVNRAASGDNP